MAQILRTYKSDIIFFIRYYGSQRHNNNHYDTLCVSKDCTQQEIRKAFLKLSKKMHPDVSGTEGHTDFVKLYEAYNTLNKEHTRRQYDSHLKYNEWHSLREAKTRPHYYYRSRREWEQDMAMGAWSSYPFPQYNRTQDRNRSLKIFLSTLIVVVIASFLQVIVLRKFFNREDYMSRIYRDIHEHKRRIDTLTREEQLQIFSNKINQSKCEVASTPK